MFVDVQGCLKFHRSMSLSMIVFVAVLFSAALHAGWNLLIKLSPNNEFAMGAVVFGHVPYALIGLLIFPLPVMESWPFIIAGAGVHVGYQFFLGKAYKIGNYSQIYPIARGIAPMIIAVFSVVFLDFSLTILSGSTILIICLGVISLGASSLKINNKSEFKPILFALITGVFIATYSLIDGVGALKAGTALGFYSWLALFNAFLMYTLIAFQKRKRPAIRAYIQVPIFWIGGLASFSAFAISIWAFTQAPIALVSALRESSIIFAMIFGYFFLNEKSSPSTYFSISIIFVGLVISRLA